MTKDPREGLGLNSVTRMLQAQDPDFFRKDIKEITYGSSPWSIHIRCHNGDEFDYEVESVRTKLAKVEKEKRYRFKKIFSAKEIVDKYCEFTPGCYDGCVLHYNDGVFGGCCLNGKNAIEKLIRCGIIEEVKE